MSALQIASIMFVCIFTGANIGMLLNKYLPDDHLSKETQDVVRLGAGVIATLAALILGLLVASSKNSFDVKDREIKQLSVNLILLDRQLAHYGDETKDARVLLRRYTMYKIDSTWQSEASSAPDPHGWMLIEDIQDELRGLHPSDDAHRWLQARALEVSSTIAQARWLLEVQEGSSISTPFLVILAFWLTIIFASFSLFARPNPIAVGALLLCSLSVAGSIFLIIEMDRPFDGLIKVSSSPVRVALAQLGE
jgi:hypothetical protein